jgi:hypothetical protein
VTSGMRLSLTRNGSLICASPSLVESTTYTGFAMAMPLMGLSRESDGVRDGAVALLGGQHDPVQV